MRRLPFLAALAILLPSGLSAQYAASQAGTLKGLDKVVVVFAEPNNKVDPEIRADLYQAVTLELRKVGIRVASDASELDMTHDGILNVSLFVNTGLGDNGTLRMDVEQQATLVRTGETSQMVTWFFEAGRSNNSWRNWVKGLVTEGVNKFLSDWLDANGR